MVRSAGSEGSVLHKGCFGQHDWTSEISKKNSRLCLDAVQLLKI